MKIPEKLETRVYKRIKQLHLKKTRSDAVGLKDIIVGASADFMLNLDPQTRKQYFTDALHFFQQRYGKENVMYCQCHMDESNPHIPHRRHSRHFRWAAFACDFFINFYYIVFSNEKNNDNNYQNILQGKLTNAIVNNVKFSLGYINSISHGFKFDTNVQRVFDVFTLKLTRTLPYKKTMPDSDWKKYITLKEYMDLCQIKNSLCAVEQIKNALNLINRIHVEFTDTRFISKKKTESIYYCFNIADNIERKKGRGIYSIVFNVE